MLTLPGRCSSSWTLINYKAWARHNVLWGVTRLWWLRRLKLFFLNQYFFFMWNPFYFKVIPILFSCHIHFIFMSYSFHFHVIFILFSCHSHFKKSLKIFKNFFKKFKKNFKIKKLFHIDLKKKWTWHQSWLMRLTQNHFILTRKQNAYDID